MSMYSLDPESSDLATPQSYVSVREKWILLFMLFTLGKAGALIWKHAAGT